MPQYFVKALGSTHLYRLEEHLAPESAVEWLKGRIESALGLPANLQRLRVSPWRISASDAVESFGVEVLMHLEGGKGGFGTLLRGGNTNRQGPVNNDSSRDLEGRRLRDATALSKIQKAIDKKQAKLDGVELSEEEDEEEHKKGKRKMKKRKQPRASSSATIDPTAEEELKYEAKRRKEEAIRQTHRQVVEETTDAVLAGIAVSSDQSRATTAAPSRAVLNMFGDIYDAESDDEEASGEEESNSSDETEAAPPAKSAPKASHPEPSKPETVSSAPTTAKPATTTNTKAVEADLPIRDGMKRSHETMEANSTIDLMKYDNSVALEALGLDKLKEELGKRGLMIGGNLTQRAVRLFQVRGLTPEQYPQELLAKSKKPKTQ